MKRRVLRCWNTGALDYRFHGGHPSPPQESSSLPASALFGLFKLQYSKQTLVDNIFLK
jgi:hypothetical protein